MKPVRLQPVTLETLEVDAKQLKGYLIANNPQNQIGRIIREFECFINDHAVYVASECDKVDTNPSK